MNIYINKAKRWLSNNYDDLTKFKVKYLMSYDLNELKDCFYKNLDFGTGGIRGLMGVGPNRINKYTVGVLSYGLSLYLKKYNTLSDKHSVVIGYDVRNNSKYLALVIANVLLNNNIKVHFFTSFKSTPELSYYVNFLKCNAGVMVTGSHNSKEYNGCKVYNNDGSQMVFPEDVKLLNIINNIVDNEIKINYNINSNIIYLDDNKLRLHFINDCIQHSVFRDDIDKTLINLVFTPLHGTATYLMCDIFYIYGFKNINVVKEQMCIDGMFSTVNSPNPEDPDTFKLSIIKCNSCQADIILSTDCDADRIGVAVRNKNNDIIILDGNQINTIFIYYILSFLKKNNKLNKKSFIVSTIVSSDIFLKIANLFNIKCYLSLTGFKWIAKLIKNLTLEGYRFIAGGEESFGFMVSDFIKDKNSFTSMLLMTEIASYYKHRNLDIYTQLSNIYKSVGYYKDYNYSLFFHGSEGSLKINNIMSKLRKYFFINLFKYQIESIEDYKNSYIYYFKTKKKEKIFFQKSNILIYRFVDGSKICIRPSGTEPKIKLYFSVVYIIKKDIIFNKITQFLTKKIQVIFDNFLYIINL
jgi:phosphoglucomutase